METGNFERSSVHRADKAGFFLAVINDCGVAWCDQKPQRTLSVPKTRFERIGDVVHREQDVTLGRQGAKSDDAPARLC